MTHVYIGEGEFQPKMPWPFPNDSFPQDLGAVVMRNVLSGKAPALQVVHFEDGTWGIADGRSVPSERNLEATHIWHVIGSDRTLAELATLPPGHQADRDAVTGPWVISLHDTRPNPTVVDRIRLVVGILRGREQETSRWWHDRFGPMTSMPTKAGPTTDVKVDASDRENPA